jgi:exodeoxyribonuclease VII large subunit
MNNEASFLSVSQINNLLKRQFDENEDLHNLTIKGEIGTLRKSPNAIYFLLKDEKSQISCLMWSDSLIYLPFEPKDGDEVLASGSIRVYEARGVYQLYVSSLSLFGQGAALLKLEALKKKMQAEGLFDESRKRPIKEFPSKIGLIVGKGSAAEADLLKNLQRRWPLADIIEFPSLVQGAEAPKDLLRAFNLSKTYPLDTLIVARGGGSQEDLWAFNDETLARAVAFSPCPVISAVGHEIDTTLIDYVSDKRVSTPTGAAEAATPDQEEIRQRIDDLSNSLQVSLTTSLEGWKRELSLLSSRPFFQNPSEMYAKAKDDVKNLGERLALATANALTRKKEAVASLNGRLKALSPYGVLGRGYSITVASDGSILSSVKDAKSGEEIKTQLKDGIIHSKVE